MLLALVLGAVGISQLASGHNVAGPTHSGPSGAGVHSLAVRSGIDPTSPPWIATGNPAYAPALPGTGYIAPPGGCGSGAAPNGSPHTVSANFTLPSGAMNPSILVQVHADNAVAVRLNGRLLGGQSPAQITTNFQGAPESYTVAGFQPVGALVGGTNTLQFTLHNYGGPCGLDYLATVAFTFFNCPGGGGLVAGNGALTGTPGNDIIVGGTGPDTIRGGGGHDLIVGNGGNDVIDGEAGDDCMIGGDGDDDLFGGPGHDTLLGADQNDDLFGDIGDDSLDGGDGIDRITGNDGADVLQGGGGDDRLNANAGDDFLGGGLDNDVLDGELGRDALSGGPGTDRLDDSAIGNDVDALSGEGDADVMNAIDGDGGDTLWGPETPLPTPPAYAGTADPNDTCTADNTDYHVVTGIGCP